MLVHMDEVDLVVRKGMLRYFKNCISHSIQMIKVKKDKKRLNCQRTLKNKYRKVY